jgi:hypothetical protein
VIVIHVYGSTGTTCTTVHVVPTVVPDGYFLYRTCTGGVSANVEGKDVRTTCVHRYHV